VTNDKGILQVSPGDGLTSLTRYEPGAPVATGPDRYYPSQVRTFLRLVPTDYLQAAALVRWAHDGGARRLVLVQDERLFGRELAAQARYAAAKMGMTVGDVVEVHDDPASYPALASRIAQATPDAVIYTGLGDPPAGPALAALETALPGVALYGGSALATAAPVPPRLPRTLVVKPALPVSLYGPRARRVMVRLERRSGPAAALPEALYGYEAMRLVLDALDTAGRHSGDRAAVVRAALAPRARTSVIGDYRVVAGGDVSTTRFGSYRRGPGGMSFAGIREAPPASH
jgi:branched-chain amino acid transport system substrate-binding protein